MRIYEYGKISEAVRAKIENTKQSIQGGTSSAESFSDILKGYMTVESSGKKVVSATGNYGRSQHTPSVNGTTLLYALRNSDEDTTASAVLSMLGFEDYGDNGTTALRTAADSLVDSASMLVELNDSGTANAAAVTEFVSDFNKLSARLNAESSSSSYLYKTAFSAALTAAKDKLSEAGITYENDVISYNGQGGSIPEDFLTSVISAASTVSAYASSVTGDSEENDNGVSDYYTALMGSMM